MEGHSQNTVNQQDMVRSQPSGQRQCHMIHDGPNRTLPWVSSSAFDGAAMLPAIKRSPDLHAVPICRNSVCLLAWP